MVQSMNLNYEYGSKPSDWGEPTEPAPASTKAPTNMFRGIPPPDRAKEGLSKSKRTLHTESHTKDNKDQSASVEELSAIPPLDELMKF